LLKRPNTPYELDAALLLCQCLEAQGKTDQAVEQYRDMVKKAPPARQAEGLYSLGVALYKTGKYPEAVAELASVVSRHPNSPCAPPARLQLGLAQFAYNKPAEARKTLAGVAKDDAARAPVARYWLAQCDMAEKDYASARSALDALAQSDPPHPNAEAIAYDRAVCAMELGKHADAAGEFVEFRRQWPKSDRLTDAAYRQAFCLHRLGKYPESLQLCQQVAQAPACGVTAAAAELAAENLVLMRKYPEAAKAFSALAKTARSDEQKLRVSLRLGQCAHLSGEYATAIAILKPLAADAKSSASPEFQDVLLVLGDALLQAG
jgi:TolA-binding protein